MCGFGFMRTGFHESDLYFADLKTVYKQEVYDKTTGPILKIVIPSL